MNQTRTILLFAWLAVATLLYMEWNKEHTAPPVPATPVAQVDAAAGIPTAPVPTASAAAVAAGSDGTTPVAPVASKPAIAPVAAAVATAPRVVLQSDVLRMVLDGGQVLQADLLQYPQTKAPGSPPLRLMSIDPAHYYVAQAGWAGAGGHKAPSHENFVPDNVAGQVTLADGAADVSVPFIWRGPDGVTVHRTFTARRGQYAVTVRDEVVNAGQQPWQGYAYHQLVRNPPEIKSGMTNPESFSFSGATWYSAQHGYQRLKFKNFMDDGKMDQEATSNWIAMLQHHFFSAWIQAPKDTVRVQTDKPTAGALVRAFGPELTVAPGRKADTESRLYIGPKLVSQIAAQGAPGLDRAVDYSQFSILALMGQGLFWVLSHLHQLLGNWGWSIIGLVICVKIIMFPISQAQYKSQAKMRKFQPRLAQLKERYGDDRAKFSAAQMELFKKEKINPLGGCLPALIQMPVFLSLYWVLVESVELRQAPWFLWIQDLTARDPYFILPIVNMVVMYSTQKLTPAPGMDPTQQKMMQFMPLVFGVMMAFFPAGLVLYWVTNGSLGLLQQWWMGRIHGEPAVPAKA